MTDRNCEGSGDVATTYSDSAAQIASHARAHEPRRQDFVLTMSCRESRHVAFDLASVLHGAGCSIVDSQQFWESGADGSGMAFMRIRFTASTWLVDSGAIEALLEPARLKNGMALNVRSLAHRPRILLLVSRHGHCLNDLLFRCRSGQMNAEVVGIVSNHNDFSGMAACQAIPFHHLPLPTGATHAVKRAQERRIEQLVLEERLDLVVLARYMQILTPELCAFLEGRAINIHHGFLPSFKGAKPYSQAHAQGVKLIGATAHYVTAQLDEGPIIEQEVARVEHATGPEDLEAVGRDVECVVLARAVRWHLEHRVLLNGRKTVVFK